MMDQINGKLDWRLLVQVGTLVGLGLLGYAGLSGKIDSQASDIAALKELPGQFAKFREDSIRQESKLSKIDSNAARLEAVERSVNDVRATAMEVSRMSGALMTRIEFEKWLIKYQKANPTDSIPDMIPIN